jgi:molybdate transport system substrate-binding protein
MIQAFAAVVLNVFAAASLSEAFTALGAEFERSHPGVSVGFNFAGSQQLVFQMEQGANADVFASADQRWMEYAREHDLVAEASSAFARNRLVVIVPRTNPARIGRLEDLARRGVKLVLAADAVPAGKYSREMLRNLRAAPGFPPEYDKRVLANVVSEEDNVKAVVAKVQLGEADAGVAYRSDVTAAVARHIRVFEIADPYNVLASYPIAVTRSTADPENARAFLELVESPLGQRVLAQYGFLPAEESVPLPAASP